MISLKDLHATYETDKGDVEAVSGVTLDIQSNEILGIAGESGCGKSTLLKVLYDYVHPPLKIVSGDYKATMQKRNGESVVLGPGDIRNYWWQFISYIPQGSMSVLNPVIRIENQFFDAVANHSEFGDTRQIREHIAAYLKELELPVEVLTSYPHQLSGGMKQRVLVALGTFFNPQIVLADEPTTALDVIVQKTILLMLTEVQARLKNTLIIVSHDLGVHYQITHRMAIMYGGKIVELGPTEQVFNNPLHPYTQMLIQSLPSLGDRGQRTGIAGRPPSLINPPEGCRFAPRCPHVMDQCRSAYPGLKEYEPGHFAACYLHEEISRNGQND